MTDDTATTEPGDHPTPKGYRKGWRGQGVVRTNPFPPGIPNGACITPTEPAFGADADARLRERIGSAVNLFKACADPAVCYDFSSDLRANGERLVITVTASPRTTE